MKAPSRTIDCVVIAEVFGADQREHEVGGVPQSNADRADAPEPHPKPHQTRSQKKARVSGLSR